MIAADDDAMLLRPASPQGKWRSRTNVRKIDRGMPSRIHAPECAERLFEKQCHARAQPAPSRPV